MRLLSLLLILVITSCSTGKVSNEKISNSNTTAVSKDSFKKEKAFTPAEVNDFYIDKPITLNSALQDETLDRYTADEIGKLADNKDPLIEIAIRCSKKDFEKAFSFASTAFNRYQKIPAYWNMIANCHLNQGSIRKALLFYNKALEVGPGYVPALNNIGVLYSRQGEDQKALVAFEKSNKQSRFSKTPRYNLARLYLSYGLADLALPLFQGLLNESISDVDLLNAVGSCYFLLSDYQKAISYYSLIPVSVLRKAEIGLNYSVTLHRLGKTGEAQKIYSDVEEPKTQALKEYYSTVKSQLGVKL